MLDYLESKTFEVLLNEMLEQVPDDVDKREGSVIYDALAPTALKLAETFNDMAILYRRTFAATSDGDDLEKRVNEHGVERKQAGYAIRRAIFTDRDGEPLAVALNSLYRLNDITYKVVEQIDSGEFKVEAQTAGSVGNKDYGNLLPVEANNELGAATLADVIIPGEDEESDESLYEKYLDHIRNVAFGGNRTEYKREIMEIQGVGGVRLYRAPQGGGTVRAVIIDSDFKVPTIDLVELVQETIDPFEYTGDGYGTAPIGHSVTVEAAVPYVLDFETTLTLNGVTLGQVEALVNEVVENYFVELRTEWTKVNEKTPIYVRLIHLEARILNIDGVVDVRNSKLNGLDANVEILNDLPVLGQVTLNE